MMPFAFGREELTVRKKFLSSTCEDASRQFLEMGTSKLKS